MVRKILKPISLFASLLLALVLNLVLHELGHLIVAILTGNKVGALSYGVQSYVGIQVINSWSAPIISIGSFLLPAVIALTVFVFCKNRVIPNLIIMPLAALLGLNIIMNSVVSFVGSANETTWDLLMFIQYANLELYKYIVGVVSLIIGILFIIFSCLRYFKVLCRWI